MGVTTMASHAQEDEELTHRLQMFADHYTKHREAEDVEAMAADLKDITDYFAAAREQSLAEVREQMLELIPKPQDARKVDRGNEAYNLNAADYRMGFELAAELMRQKVNDL
jgi:hypothetical protein